MLDLYVYSLKIEGNDLAALSLLPPHLVEAHGLPTEAVLGEVDPRRPEMTVEGFTPNEAFLAFLHALVQAYAPALPSVQRQVEAVQNGPVYVVDRRNLNAGENPPFEDVLGWFGVRNGALLAESYNPNPNYQLLGNAGPPQLEQALEAALLRETWARLGQGSTDGR